MDSAQNETSDSDSDSESNFYDIISSEPESFSSNEEDTVHLEVVFEGLTLVVLHCISPQI